MPCTVFDGLRTTMTRTTEIQILTEEEFPCMVSQGNFPWIKEFINRWKMVMGAVHYNAGRRRKSSNMPQKKWTSAGKTSGFLKLWVYKC